MNIEDKARLFKIAYKKLKSNLYYDKTLSLVRDKIIEYECGDSDTDIDIDIKIIKLYSMFESDREKLFEEIIDKIDIWVFPKKIADESSDEEKNTNKSATKDEKIRFIKNFRSEKIPIDKNLQYFIDLPIEGHILSVLWIMLVGYKIDKDLYVHSYGNRIRKKLYNEFSEKPTFSPYLFEPYFRQYESWRDKAMDEAQQHLKSGQDVVVLTMDFERFYYSLDITSELMDTIERKCIDGDSEYTEVKRSLNNFIYRVIEKYGSFFDNTMYNERNILPIGFLPSNVLANYALRNFDKAVVDGWNPIYFGRYVDDIIIVDKIEKNSDIYSKTEDGSIKPDDIISFFLEQCSGWRGAKGVNCNGNGQFGLLIKCNDENKTSFNLNKIYNPTEQDKSEIKIQNNKLKLFYFKSGETDALITCFRDTIAKNKSEFRHMPEDEMVFQNDDYSKVYELDNDETINKFRGIKGISIDKFELSKLLGKHLRISGLISDKKETNFEKQIMKLLSPTVIIENYGVWEKVIESLVINESWDTLKELVEKILNAIENIVVEEDRSKYEDALKNTLKQYLLANLCKGLALVWGKEVDALITNIVDIYNNNNTYGTSPENINKKRKWYCITKMVDKSVMPVFVGLLALDKIFKADKTVNLSSFQEMIGFCKGAIDEEYIYYPYLISMYDFSVMECCLFISKKNSVKSFDVEYTKQIKRYMTVNYQIKFDNKGTDSESRESKKNSSSIYEALNNMVKVGVLGKRTGNGLSSYRVTVNNGNKDKMRIAIANVRINHDSFSKIVIDKPDRSYLRYANLSEVINQAIDENADLLVMPEAYLPFEWLLTVARTCAKNDLAVVTGIEHIKYKRKIFNYTAVILPYDDGYTKSAIIVFHLKTKYAPEERTIIEGYRYTPIEGDCYELYNWYGNNFPVYCCYELSSIHDRALFQSYADYIVAIECNKDINYYSNILESLSRDIHCYCVQVNSSDYGDSRITKPSPTEDKDILRTKGGQNSTVLVDEIDIGKLRKFQIKEYELQKRDKSFKPTPPDFDPEEVVNRMKTSGQGTKFTKQRS